MKSKYDLLEHCRKALANKVKYVYGAKMQILTAAQIKQLQKIYGKGCVWDSDINKAGSMCCDCSGLISSCTGTIRGSTQYKATALACVPVSTVKKDWQKYVGWAFWMQGHIGVVSDKEGYYYAMDGSARNMVHFPLAKQSWTYAIKLCDIDYSAKDISDTSPVVQIKGDDEVVSETKITVNGKEYKINRILKEDCNYIKLADLQNMGFDVGYNKDTKMLSLANRPEVIAISAENVEKKVKAVNIGGFNYVKLRDIADSMGFAVECENGKIKIK